MYVVVGDYYYLTAYFTDPSKICNPYVNRPKSLVGDKLIFMTGYKQYMTVPRRESGLKNTKWKKGKCFTGMGK